MKKIIKPLIALGAFTASIFVAMPIADAVQNDFGNVEVSLGYFEDSETEKALTYKLYKPVDVSETNKAPAVLLLHGYQNDHETNSAFAIELARRGLYVYHSMNMDMVLLKFQWLKEAMLTTKLILPSVQLIKMENMF